ncbi:hypothetical protein ACJX0J_039088, partial [Zea mays]
MQGRVDDTPISNDGSTDGEWDQRTPEKKFGLYHNIYAQRHDDHHLKGRSGHGKPNLCEQRHFFAKSIVFILPKYLTFSIFNHPNHLRFFQMTQAYYLLHLD